MPVLVVFFRLRMRSIRFAPDCRKGSFCLHAKLPKVLRLSYFNGARAKKFRDWRRVKNGQVWLAADLAGIKMTGWFPGTRGGLRLGRRVQPAGLAAEAKKKRRVAPPAPDSLTL